MKKLLSAAGALAWFALAGCASTTSESQREALTHQQNSDEAAKRGAYGIAAQEQRAAEDSHHDAVVKALKTGETVPPPTQPGDKPPPKTK